MRIWNKSELWKIPRFPRVFPPNIKENQGREGLNLFFLKKNQKNLVKSLEV